jgi:hypothetical protein
MKSPFDGGLRGMIAISPLKEGKKGCVKKLKFVLKLWKTKKNKKTNAI